MKKTILTSAAFLAASTALFAQSLNISAPGYSGAKLFDSTPGFTITGLAAAPGGDVFYIETDSATASPTFTPAHSMLYRRSAGGSYAAATPLFDFGAKVFGSFVRWESGRVFFGESSTGALRVMNADLSIDALGSVARNYDAAFSGGSLFLSHNPSGSSAETKVSRFDLLPDGGGGQMLGPAVVIVDTPDDYPGPIAFNSAGDLFYGGSGVYGRSDLYRFAAGEVSAALAGGPTVSLDAPHLFLANGSNAALAFDAAAGLWHTDFATLDLIDPGTALDTVIGDNPNPYGIGQLDVADGTLYAVVTNTSFTQSAVFAIVPEPCAGALLLLGVAALTPRRRRGEG